MSGASGGGINREAEGGTRNCVAEAGMSGMKRDFRAEGGSGAAGGVKKRERIGMAMNREKNGAGGMAACHLKKRLRFGCRKREPLRESYRGAVSGAGGGFLPGSGGLRRPPLS